MDHEMIERVELAIRLAIYSDNKGTKEAALVAIKAMRELNTELIAAGDIQIEFDGSFELAWHKTIDAITND